MKKLLLVCATTVTLALSSMAQAFHSDSLLATNSAFPLFPTNLIAANYFVSTDPNVPVPGNGLFEIKPQMQPNNVSLLGMIGPAFQLTYWEASSTNLNTFSPVGTNAVLVATFQPLLDDATIKDLGSLSAPTNNLEYTVSFTLSSAATNGYYLATKNSLQTNSFNCKWSKLVSLDMPGSPLPTNCVIVIRGLRVGYPGPVAAPLSQ